MLQLRHHSELMYSRPLSPPQYPIQKSLAVRFYRLVFVWMCRFILDFVIDFPAVARALVVILNCAVKCSPYSYFYYATFAAFASVEPCLNCRVLFFSICVLYATFGCGSCDPDLFQMLWDRSLVSGRVHQYLDDRALLFFSCFHNQT